jgi:N utilization substance protein A
MRELHGEKIDVILYSEDLITFAQNALAPAKITRVSPIHHEDGTMSLDCVVEDDQLSLAIGKKGQNVRLASALIGMKIEIKGETEVKGEVAEALSRMLLVSRRKQTPVAEVPGLGDEVAGRLSAAGIATLGDLLEKSTEELAAVPGLEEFSPEEMLEVGRSYQDSPEEEEAEEEPDAESEELEADASGETAEESIVRE